MAQSPGRVIGRTMVGEEPWKNIEGGKSSDADAT